MGFDCVQALLQDAEQLLRLGRIVTVFVQLTRYVGLTVDPRLGFAICRSAVARSSCSFRKSVMRPGPASMAGSWRRVSDP